MSKPIHVSLIAIPDASISTLHGIYDVLNSFQMLKDLDDAVPDTPPFMVEIVGEYAGGITLASGLQTQTDRSINELKKSDIIIVPSVVLSSSGWKTGRYTKLLAWLKEAHNKGTVLCSACSGVFLIAETGLLNARDITLHWGYAQQFQKLFPEVVIHPEQSLVISGEREQFVTSGASMSWHDLVLYLIAKHVGPTAAQTVAKFFALQWHHDGLGPYMIFEGRNDHGDATVLEAQSWLSHNFSIANPVDELVRRSGLAERTFKRRFINATGHAPLVYAQQLRIKEAKRMLERTDNSVDEISWRVGYEEPAFFRRLFKRIAGVTPGQYRRQFQIPRM